MNPGQWFASLQLAATLFAGGFALSGATLERPVIGRGDEDVAKAVQSKPSETGTYDDIAAFVASRPMSTNAKLSIAEGDLNGDGRPDAIIMLEESKPHCQAKQIFILLRSDQGKLVLAEQTAPVCSGDLTAKVSIAKGSAFIYLEAIKGAWGTAQFKLIGKRFELIGLRLHVASGGNDDVPLQVVDTDFNFRTGDVGFERTGDNRTTKAHATGPVCTLHDFDYSFFFCADRWHTASGQSVERLMMVDGGSDSPAESK